MATEFGGGHGMSRRSMLGTAGTALGAAMVAGPAATAAARYAPVIASDSGRYLRELGSADLWCSSPGLAWGDIGDEPISVSLTTTGRLVRITARMAMDYGGPDGSCVGLSFAEDGVDMHREDERGFATARIEGSTVVSATLEASTVRQVLPGPHTWTLRVRHENPLSDEAAQRSYVRTRQVAPLEFTAVEL